MRHDEFFNVRMDIQETPAKTRKEVSALLGLIRQMLESKTDEFEAFRVVIVGLEDKRDPHLCPLCKEGWSCEYHRKVLEEKKEADA